jgi:DNA replication and repair protein RecF
MEFIERLQKACNTVSQRETRYLQKATISLGGSLEESLTDKPALKVEEVFLSELEKSRASDAVTGGTSTGPHRSDLLVRYAETNMPAEQCSTGEQKALLTGIILAHSRLIAAERGMAPVLLLDEVAAHLDDERRVALFEILLKMKCQVWLTGTDKGLFSGLEKRAQFFKVFDSQIGNENST